MTTNISSGLRLEVWNQLVDAERLVRYYGRLSDHYNRLNVYLRVFIFVDSTTGIVALLGVLPAWVAIGASAAWAVAIVLDLKWDLEKKAAMAAVTYWHCGKLLDQWRDLWLRVNVYEFEAEEGIMERFAVLRDSQTEWTYLAAFRDIAINDRINKKATKEAYEVLETYYAQT